MVDEVFYGGTRGGGKTDGLVGDYLQDVEEWSEHWRGILFRRTYPELEDCILRAKEITEGWASWNDQKKTFTFPNGAWLRMRYMEHDEDWTNYQGHQYTWIGWDELPQHPLPNNYEKMMACSRSAAGAPRRVRSSGNPGNVGQAWVKGRFIDIAPPRVIVKLMADDGTYTTRAFLPASVYDNKILLDKDPRYLTWLKTLPEALRRAWLDGDWSLFLGQMFKFVPRYHIAPTDAPWPPPPNAPMFTCFDYGFSRPFSYGWYWVDYDGRIFRCREWYGWNGQPNQGIRLAPSEIARGILDREEQWGIAGRVGMRIAGRDAFYKTVDQRTGEYGPTINEIFALVDPSLNMVPADDKHRVRCVAQVHEYLKLEFDDHGGLKQRPMLQIYPCCTQFLRTFPNLVADKHNPEDVDTEQEDHAFDELKYALMSRPLAARQPKQEQSLFAQIIARAEAPHGGREVDEVFAQYVAPEEADDLSGLYNWD